MFKKIIKKIIRIFYKGTFSKYFKKSYSQEGEDIILNKLLEGRDKGYYVDIGAHHPKRFSNTYFFYKKGWSGINVDAKPGSMKIFDKLRSRDLNIEIGLSSVNEIITFYVFNEPALNTFDKQLANSRISDFYHIIDEIPVRCMTLEGVLDRYLPLGTQVTFLSIDIEGYDLKVLSTNDWVRFSPEYLIVESYDLFITDVIKSEIYEFLVEKKYNLVSKSCYSLIFKRSY